MGPSLKTPKLTAVTKNQLDTSNVKEKKVNYLRMETLKRITLQFMQMLVWRQCIKEKIVIPVNTTKIDVRNKFVG
jgi:hypothetical protein